VRKEMAKGTIVVKKAIKRQKGMLYFVDRYGNIRKTGMKRR
jgi:hypothetical protein